MNKGKICVSVCAETADEMIAKIKQAEEFADVIAWLCTLANISDVNLSEAIAKKYLGEKPPEGHK